MLVVEEKTYGDIDVGSITSRLMSKGIGLNIDLSLGGSSSSSSSTSLLSTSTSSSSSGDSFPVSASEFAQQWYNNWGGLLFQKPQTFGVNLLAGTTPKPSLSTIAQQNNGSFLSSLWGGVKDVLGGVFEGVKQSLPNLLQTYIGLKLAKPIIKEKMKLQMMSLGSTYAPTQNNTPSQNVGRTSNTQQLPPEYIEYLRRQQQSKSDTTKYLLIGGAALGGILLLTLLMHRD